MWEFWRSRLSKQKGRRTRGSESDSPYSARSAEPHPFNLLTSPEYATHIYFKDLKLPATDDSEEEEQGGKRVDKQKLVIVLVGLPGRGKTFLCNKLICYLNWCACSNPPSFCSSLVCCPTCVA